MQDLYPPISPFKQTMLSVGDGHELYVECCGNPEGYPILFVHGGPGAGCSENDRRFFDPEHYYIVLFDQRGCGRSKPFGSLQNNTTQKLVDDIEAIRTSLDIKAWHVFGGSWGATLALVYAQTFPDNVTALILRGIFLAREKDKQWFTGEGAARLFPDKMERLRGLLPDSAEGPLLEVAHQTMINQEDQSAARNAAKGWAGWEASIACLSSQPDTIFDTLDSAFCWTLSRHETHYLVNDCFLEENQIIQQADKLAHIPLTIVHGRYDIVCPFDNAWSLHKAVKHSELNICDQSGHASSEPQIRRQLVLATDKMRQIG